jgi:outer membrane protein assembly factor BamE (lipoprotein component of BamABCDE complex)
MATPRQDGDGVRRLLPSLFLLAALLPACSVVETPRTLRGNKVDADQLKELVPGTSTRADVTSLLGSPTTRATFDDNEWIYISETTRTRVGRTPGVLAQNVTVLTFDDKGVLRGVKRLNEEDSRPVDVVARATPSPGSDASFLQQLLGNVGKFNTGGLGATADTAPGGGVGSSRGSSR